MSARRVAFALLGLVALAGSAAAQTITVRPAGDLSSLVGMPFDVPIVADWSARTDRLGSFAVTLRWDPAVLRFDAGGPGSFGSIEANSDSAAQGVLKLAGANPAGLTGIVTLGVGRFTPLTATSTTVTLQLGDIYSSSPDFTNLTGAASVQSGLFCPARGHWGDPDQDQSAGSRDALIALTEAVGLDVSAFPEHGLADVDADGSVKARDALIILSHAVGFDVSGYRVLRIAVGSCGSDQTTTYAVTPTGQTIVARGDNALRFELRATAGGAVRTLPDVFWRSSDPAVLAVLPDGRGMAVGPGSAVVIGKSGQVDSATATITVVARRSRHVVDALAISATNRLGTLAYPYAALAEASAAAFEGDTVVVQPGRYADAAIFNVGVIVLGQTSGSNQVVLAGDDGEFGAALMFTGGARAEVHNVSAERVGVAVAAIGVDTLVVDSLRYNEGAGFCGDYAVAASEIWRLEVRRSDLRGGGQATGCAGAIGVNGNARFILVDNVTVSDFADDAVYAGSVDSIVVQNSRFSYNGSYAVDVSSNRFGGGAIEVPTPASTALVLQNNVVIADGYGSGVNASNLRRGRLAHNTIQVIETDAMYLEGTSDSTDRVDIVADTIRGHENYWLSAYSIDTLRADSLVVLETQEGYFYDFRDVRVTNSLFDNLEGPPLYFEGGNGTPALVDKVTIHGSLSCPRCEDGIYFYGTPGIVDHSTISNVGQAVTVFFAPATIAHTTMSDLNTGVYAHDNSGAASRIVARGLTMTNVNFGIQTFSNATVADSLDISNAFVGVQGSSNIFVPSGVDSVTNSIIRDAATGIELNDTTVVVAGNTILRPGDYGIRVNGNGTAQDSTFVSSNTITCDAAGAVNGVYGVYTYGFNPKLTGNTVSGCATGLYVSSTTSGTAVLRNNVISQPPEANNWGIVVPAPLRAEIVGNTILGSGVPGAIYLAGFNFTPIPYARVDSNTVRGVQMRGIWFEYTDSILVRGNLIDTVRTSSYYSNGGIGIGIQGATNGLASFVGNRVRHVQGDGMYLDHLGSALLVVDSNAISQNDTTAVRMVTGQLSMSANNVTNNARYGLWNLSFTGTQQVHGNAFTGNGLYAVKSDSGPVADVTGNWWGAAGGPGTPGADSVSGVVDPSPLAAPPGGLLSPSAPAPLLAAYRAPLPSFGSPRVAVARPATAAREPVVGARHERRAVRAVATETKARQAGRPALPAALAGIRRAP